MLTEILPPLPSGIVRTSGGRFASIMSSVTPAPVKHRLVVGVVPEPEPEPAEPLPAFEPLPPPLPLPLPPPPPPLWPALSSAVPNSVVLPGDVLIKVTSPVTTALGR